MKKHVPFFALVLIFALVFAGCDAQPNSPSQAVASVTTPPTLQTWEGYTAELVSAIPESHSVYVTLRTTAPEDVDVSQWMSRKSEAELSLRNLKAISTANGEEATTSYFRITEDPQGRNQVLDVILQVRPVALEGESSPFGPGNSCRITFDAMVLRQGQEETVLASGDWQFSIDLSESDTDTLELLTQPLAARAQVVRQVENDPLLREVSEEITITSIQLRPTSVTAVFEPPELADTFGGLFLDTAPVDQPEDGMYVMMKDGTKISYLQREGAMDTAILQADRPVDFLQADYLHLFSGIEIPICP